MFGDPGRLTHSKTVLNSKMQSINNLDFETRLLCNFLKDHKELLIEIPKYDSNNGGGLGSKSQFLNYLFE
jgi:hypothetical protein